MEFSTRPPLDLSVNTASGTGAPGLKKIALHPNFLLNGFVYLSD